jgi:hypothetical protein
LGGIDQLWPIVGLLAHVLVIGEDSPQLRIVEVTLIQQHTDEWPLHKRMTPLPTGADALGKKRRDRRLKARIVAPVGAAIVPAVGEFAFCGA